MIILIILTLLLFALGIAFLRGKGTFLIAGYNTASPEEKEKINLKKLCKYMAILMFLNAACCFAFLLAILFENNAILYTALSVFVAADIILIVIMNTKNRLDAD